MKVLVDGVFFQRGGGGIARYWSSVLPLLAARRDLSIVLLDRGGCPVIDGIERTDFPAYTITSTAADSLLIDRFCSNLGVDVFTSTYYTTPVTIPSVLVVYDMIPEVLGFDLTARDWQEKQSAISFAWYYACISQNTRADLKRFYPSIRDDRASVVYCGVDHNVFRPRRSATTVRQGRQRGLKPYYMLVGARHQHKGYKNADLLIEAFRRARIGDADILCVGGEPEILSDWHRDLPASVSIRRVELADEELADAYAGAEALIYPSLYEGFGLPVLEAMACGCPVITARRGSLGEIAAGAACYIGGTDADELAQAMVEVRDGEYRSRLIGLGLEQASRFSWSRAAEGLVELFQRAIEERSSAGAAAFFGEWRRLRTIQAEVDIGLP